MLCWKPGDLEETHTSAQAEQSEEYFYLKRCFGVNVILIESVASSGVGVRGTFKLGSAQTLSQTGGYFL